MRKIIAEQLAKKLQLGGFVEIFANGIACRLYFRRQKTGQLVCIIEDASIGFADPYESAYIVGQLKAALEEREQLPCEILLIAVIEDIAEARQLSEIGVPVWFYHPKQLRIVFENQPAAWHGVESLLEQPAAVQRKNFLAKQIQDAGATIALIIINMLVQIVVVWQMRHAGTSSLLEHMVLKIGDFIEKPEYYRLLSCAFAHFGWEHIGNNMISLFFLGRTVEKVIGKKKFLTGYFICALFSSVLSLVWYQKQEMLFVSTAGASGAIFGIAGLLLVLVIKHHGRLEEITTRRMLLMLLFTLNSGYASASSVNVMGHAAGAVGGIFFGIMLVLLEMRDAKRRKAQAASL